MRFTINAGIEYVQGWILSLDSRLRLFHREYVTERGNIMNGFQIHPKVGRADRYEIQYYLSRIVNGEQMFLTTAWTLPVAIAFDLRALAADRTELDIPFERDGHLLDRLLDDVLVELHRAYPETAPTVTDLVDVPGDGDAPPAEAAPLPPYEKAGRKRDPWNQAAIDRLWKGDPVDEVRSEWRVAYAEGTGDAPDEKTWQKRVWRPYLNVAGGPK